ncbi:hypothetical protein SLEP1_g16048 [Rubroshorea leprosula]|uniref:Uncharacterized protein n=1 Tax=Rubroshorea leprosula TaxID=152421 RepID=A0AAV5IPK6_9ROSI|nr:hypothetical protein SLEP1_g16048 [Rubroshorea leprosula]
MFFISSQIVNAQKKGQLLPPHKMVSSLALRLSSALYRSRIGVLASISGEKKG